MKRFRFSLETLDRVKKMREKEQKSLLLAINQELARLYQQRDDLQSKYEDEGNAYRESSQQGTDATTLQIYASFFIYLREVIEQLAQTIEEKERERMKIQEALIRLMQEIKALEKLRERQYQQYLVDVRIEEEKEIGDFVAFHSQFG